MRERERERYKIQEYIDDTMTDNDNGSEDNDNDNDTKATNAKILKYVSNEIVGKHMVDLGDSVLVTTILVEMGKLDLQQKNHPNDATYCF